MTAVAGLLAALAAALGLLLLGLIRKLNRMVAAMDQQLQGNYNMRIRLQSHFLPVNALCGRINRLADLLQEVMRKNSVYEADRKRMIANMSHDLRTPMTSLLGYVEVLKTCDVLSGEEREKYLDIIQAKGTALYHLIESFFQLAKLESEDVTLELAAVNLSELVRQSVILQFDDFRRQGIEPHIQLPQEDAWVMGNEEAISRIMDNLLSNSLKYGSDGKTVGVRLWKESEQAVVQVWDKGRGIPEEELPYIFDRLYTGEKSRSTGSRGSGLGLTIVRKLVEMQRGNIKAESTWGQGTAVTFRLPVRGNDI